MIELNGENYLTGNEACHLLGVKPSTLYTYVSRGVLRSYKRGIKRQSLYKEAELEALLLLRPGNDAAQIGFATAQIRLQRQTARRRLGEFLLSEDRFENAQRQLFVQVAFHVEVDERP